jgi:hypothetical protein
MICSLRLLRLTFGCLKPAIAGFRQVFGSALSLIQLLFTQMAGLQGPHELRRDRPGLLTLAIFALGIGA